MDKDHTLTPVDALSSPPPRPQPAPVLSLCCEIFYCANIVIRSRSLRAARSSDCVCKTYSWRAPPRRAHTYSESSSFNCSPFFISFFCSYLSLSLSLSLCPCEFTASVSSHLIFLSRVTSSASQLADDKCFVRGSVVGLISPFVLSTCPTVYTMWRRKTGPLATRDSKSCHCMHSCP